MHRCPFLPPSISLPLVGQSSVCTWTRAFARANATGNFAFPLCRLLDKQQRQGGVIHWHRYTGPAASQKTPLIRERPANPPLPLSLSLERVHLQNDFPTSARCTRVTWLTHASPSLSAPYFALFVESLAFRIVCPSFLNARTRIPVRFGFFQLVFLLFSFSSLIPTFHQPVMESLSRFEFETESEGVSEKETESKWDE